jgi:hypothetical protein
MELGVIIRPARPQEAALLVQRRQSSDRKFVSAVVQLSATAPPTDDAAMNMMKKLTLLRLAAIGAACALAPAASAGTCDAKVGKDNVCVAVHKFAGMLAQQLPVTEGMVTLETVAVRKNVILVGGKFDLDKAGERAFLAQHNATLKQFEDTYAAQMTPKLCGLGSHTRRLIDAGASIMYAYSFRDGKPFMTFGVKKCS